MKKNLNRDFVVGVDAGGTRIRAVLACATDGNAAKLSGNVADARTVVVFTLSEPHLLPDQVFSRAANPDFHRMNVGVCFRPDQEHGYANFWVVATFAD